jgi:glycosyltransferase involved in cell wall biosynthesis
MAKVLFVVTEDWYFCSHRLPLALALQEKGHQVVVATRLKDHRQLIEDSGIRVVALGRMKRSSLNVFREISAFIELLSIFRSERPDLIHLVAVKPAIYGSLAAMLAGVPSRVNALGGLGFVFSSNSMLARFLRPLLLATFRLIFNDSRSRLILQNSDDLMLVTERARVSRHHVRLIRSAGVDLDQYAVLDIPDGVPVVMLASRMLWDKGVGEFVEAATALKAKGVPARFVLVGNPDDDNPSSVSRKLLQDWHASGVLEWWGHRTDMPAVLSQASVVCLPSYYGEGIPKVLIEAMACGRPIVTTDMPGCRDLVRDDTNGFTVKPKDAAALAERFARLVSHRSQCKSMGVEGRRIAETEYSLTQVTQETMAVYEELLNR